MAYEQIIVDENNNVAREYTQGDNKFHIAGPIQITRAIEPTITAYVPAEGELVCVLDSSPIKTAAGPQDLVIGDGVTDLDNLLSSNISQSIITDVNQNSYSNVPLGKGGILARIYRLEYEVLRLQNRLSSIEGISGGNIQNS